MVKRIMKAVVVEVTKELLAASHSSSYYCCCGPSCIEKAASTDIRSFCFT